MINTYFASGLGDVLIVTQGWTPGEPVPSFPIDPSIITQGFLGAPGALLVGGYSLASAPTEFTSYPDPFAATSTTTVNPFAATSTSTVNPFAASSRPKGG